MRRKNSTRYSGFSFIPVPLRKVVDVDQIYKACNLPTACETYKIPGSTTAHFCNAAIDPIREFSETAFEAGSIEKQAFVFDRRGSQIVNLPILSFIIREMIFWIPI